ncbi:Abi family protein [Carnobacterium maltaromaticum]|uniref:Abi family protein n=1 Tax=Carnobacterium maltaromaticum TaxID=2751 RepID=UPI000A50C804|nr:Abi family protein [Carnobacterium maltaromaticum]
MVDEKIFLTFEEQLNRLESRNLDMGTEKEKENAMFTLQNVSYYAIVNGYKDIFIKDSLKEDDYSNETFKNLRDSYDFDKDLSSIVFKYLMKIEDSFKAILAYHTAKEFGHKEESYLVASNFRTGNFVEKEQKFESEIMIEKLTRTCLTSREPQVIHNRDLYGCIPPWVLTSALTLDNLLFWYKLSESKIKLKVFNSYFLRGNDFTCNVYLDDNERMDLFLNCMMIVKEYRNRSAHGSRIMNHKSAHNLPVNLLSLYVNDYRTFEPYMNKEIVSRGIFSFFTVITIMFSKRNTVRNQFIEEISTHFENLKIENEYLYKKIMSKIELPENFKDVLLSIV